MSKTIQQVREIFGAVLDNWELRPMPELSDTETAMMGDDVARGAFNILVDPDGEEIVCIFSSTSVTGTNRSMPQIRVFPKNMEDAFKYAKLKKLRFFVFYYAQPLSLRSSFRRQLDPTISWFL